MDFHATCCKWVDGRGYGFARLEPDNREVFLHSRVLRHRGLGETLPVGARVEVDVEAAPDGRLRVARISQAFGTQLNLAPANRR